MHMEFVLYPTMLYDGDSLFCQRRIEKWQRITREKVRYRPFQRMLAEFPQLTEEECRESVHLILPDGAMFSGVHAILKAFAVAGRRVWLLRCYEQVPFLGWIAERVYDFFAGPRSFLATLFHFSRHPER